MTEKQFKVVDNYLVSYDGDYFDLHKPSDIRSLVTVANYVVDENDKLKSENKRLTDKLNETALEFLNHDMVTMGKATEISEMCYYDFLKYRKENGNPMELKE